MAHRPMSDTARPSHTEDQPSAAAGHRAELAAAVNDPEVLNFCLARSPDLVAGLTVLRTYEKYKTASAALNAAIDQSGADYVVLVHQDVYLPAGSIARLVETLDALTLADPNWAVAGVIGKDAHGEVQGRTWSSGIGAVVGNKLAKPARVETFDEMLLVVRKSSGLRFDDKLPGWHLYGTDIVQIAKAAGRTSYAIELMAIHHSKPTVELREDYKSVYRYLQAKWRATLPIPNLICDITASPLLVYWRDFRIRLSNRFDPTRAEPQGDPAQIAADLAEA